MIINSKKEELRLTLGALIEIEEGLGVNSLTELSSKISNPKTQDIALILSALLRGGGASYSYDEIKSSNFKISSAIQEISTIFSQAFSVEGDTTEGK